MSKRPVKRRTAFIVERHPIYADSVDNGIASYHVSTFTAERIDDTNYYYNGKVLTKCDNELRSSTVRYVILAEVNCTQ